MAFDLNSDYTVVNDHFPNHSQRPLIGLTGNFGPAGCELGEGYYKSIEIAGGIPVVIPPSDNFTQILALLDRLDGIVLTGGADLNPLYLGQDPEPGLGNVNAKRDRGELLLIRLAYDRQIPMLGICRGIQMMAAALGGTIHQDLATDLSGGYLIKHQQQMARGVASHWVDIEEDSILGRLFGRRLAVNSFHHQAVNDAGPLLRVTARSADGVVEAVESTEHKTLLGVQWHPECFILERDKIMQPLFRWFVEESESFRRAAEAHRDILTLDSHCDTPMFFDQGVRFDHREPHVCVDMHKLTEGRIDAVVMAAYLKQGERDAAGLQAAEDKAFSLLNQIRDMVQSVKGAQIAYTPKDAFRLKGMGKKAVYLGVENGYAIGRDLSNVERLRSEGVVYMTLCHNGDNDICDSAVRSTGEWGGLSPFGREVVREMNRTGMMIDLSHASEQTFYDVLELSESPVVCSHSSSRACCDHPRNLTDDQLRLLAEKGGVAQVTLYPGFLREDGEADIHDVMRHLKHMIEVAGVDHVGIGSDFDGDGGVRGCRNESEMINLTRLMMADGMNLTQIRKVWGGNFIRVMSVAQYRGEVKF